MGPDNFCDKIYIRIRIMKVSQKEWQDKLKNLHTREKGISSEKQIDYKILLKKVYIGGDVLDVGCGNCWLKKLLPASTLYTGLDAYVVSSLIQHTVPIEHAGLAENSYDTLFVFAALDGMKDLVKAISEMKRIAAKNIVILTGINIPPDQYHTVEITEDFLDAQFEGWKKTVRVQVHEKIVFLEYTYE